MPYSLANKPDIYLHLVLVWIIFTLVRHCRTISEFGIGPIALTDMRAMLDEFEVDEADTRIYFLQLLQRLDVAYREFLMKQKK